MPYDLHRLAQQYTDKHKLPRNLLMAIAEVESGMNPTAKSSAGASGLMQLKESIQKEYGVKDPYNPKESLRAAAQYLSDLMRPGRFKNNELEHTLLRYNAGPTSAGEMLLGQRPYTKEAAQYADKVKNVMDILDTINPKPEAIFRGPIR
jgi:soluble lytic murein transglycosylase-like protein